MLDTIVSIGKALSQDRDAWRDIINPPLKADDKEGKLTLYQLGICFDLDAGGILPIHTHLAKYNVQ
ncbi:MAG: hypothetical protein OHK0039_41280 [Bacteroidia bacterium]